MNLNEFKQLLQKDLKISIDSYKEPQLNRKISSYINQHKLKTIYDAKKHFSVLPSPREDFLNHMTINVTSFFRDNYIFNIFKKELSMLDKTKRLRIWCAGCSIGCEAYTIAMVLTELGFSNFRIIGTDIDTSVLEQARIGIYREDILSSAPSKYILKYFDRIDDDTYKIKSSIARHVQFRINDLLTDPPLLRMDVITCRNVVIYFNPPAKERVYSKFAISLNDKSILFLGATENIYNSEILNLQRIHTYLYKKF